MTRKKYCAVVTGGSRGIGYSVAERLINDGMHVIVTGTSETSDCPDGAIYYSVDFYDNDALLNFANYLKRNQVDILVNNAGVNKIDNFSDIDIKDFDYIHNINLRAPFLLCQAVIPNMKKNGWGRIVNISSIWGKISKESRASYSASKFGLDGMTVALASEVAEMGILANCIGPGFINTDLTRKVLGDNGIEKIKSKIPIKRLGEVSEIAAFVSWLVSEENTYISGQNIMIDGGFTRV